MLTAGGKELKLSRREFELFRLLFVNSGQIILRETILDKVWTDNPESARPALTPTFISCGAKYANFRPDQDPSG